MRDPWYKWPAILLGASLVILAIGFAVTIASTGVAIAVDIIRANLATAVATKLVPTYVVKIGFYGIAATTVLAPIVVVSSGYERIKAKKYAWILPILGVFSAYTVDFCKEYYPQDHPLLKITFGAITAVVFYVAGLLWDMPGGLNKVSGILLFLLPPALILLFVARKQLDEGRSISWRAVPTQVLLSIGVFIFLSALALMLAKKYEKS